MAQTSSFWVAPRSSWMVFRATLRIVLSRMTTSRPITRTVSAFQRCGYIPAVTDWDATLPVDGVCGLDIRRPSSTRESSGWGATAVAGVDQTAGVLAAGGPAGSNVILRLVYSETQPFRIVIRITIGPMRWGYSVWFR